MQKVAAGVTQQTALLQVVFTRKRSIRVVRACNPSYLEGETGGLQFTASLGKKS
jgi:hypothetical protein